MKSRSQKIFITASMALAFVLAGMSISYAWFMATDGGGDSSELGKVEVAISGDTKVTDNHLFFTISNNSNIDTYIRLGCTPIYKDSQGNDLTYDISGINASALVDLPGSVHMPILISTTISSRNGYRKETIIFEDERGKYLVIPAETDLIEGTIYVSGDTKYSEAELHMILIPEAIQATWKAVDAAGKAPEGLTGEGYGWTTDKVGGQASTIVSPSAGGDN